MEIKHKDANTLITGCDKGKAYRFIIEKEKQTEIKVASFLCHGHEIAEINKVSSRRRRGFAELEIVMEILLIQIQ